MPITIIEERLILRMPGNSSLNWTQISIGTRIRQKVVTPLVYRGFGLGKAMLNRLVDYARERQVIVLRLETGIHQTQAIGLYERFGFRRRPPFGEYRDDPLSVYYEKFV
jgi:GNAT superfamily N-acetyltransferase